MKVWRIIPLSSQPYRPCLLLKWSSACILLDCAVDMDALSSFLPSALCKVNFFKFTSTSKNAPKQCLKRYGEHILVDGPFEVHPAQVPFSFNFVDLLYINEFCGCDIGVKLDVSSRVAVFTEETNFAGVVYATDPTLQLGRLVMEELLDFFDRVDREERDHSWKKPSLFMNFPNVPTSDPREWRPFYSREQMENCLTKVQRISFRESINIHGAATIAAYSSGYSIGSCNWIVRTEHEKIGYLSATSSRNSHTKPVQWDQLRGCDALILTSICRFPEHNPETSVCHAFAVIADTLKRNGCVLMPICPTGVLYDLLEVISMQLDQHDVPVDVPVYFISPVAESTLAYSNIYAEWLSEKKQNMVNIPEEPFKHGLMSRNGRLKVYDNIYDNFCRQMRTPCVIFTGHPSLRIGNAVHFLEILDFSQLNPSILPDLAPKLLVMPEVYAQPPSNSSQRTDFNARATFRYGDTFTIPSTTKTKRVRLHPDTLRGIELRGHHDHSDVGLSLLKGVLSVYDNILELNPDTEAKIRNLFVGKLDPEIFAQTLTKMNLKYSQDQINETVRFTFDSLGAVVCIENDGFRTVINSSNRGNRQLLSEAVSIFVLVTGASGYIALHCVQQLLESGYTVRGTVRSLQNTSKVNPLRDLKYSSERLELVEADLECSDHWPRAVEGCTYILHIASPWNIVADESTIRIAKNGTLNVLKAAAKCGTIQKIVLTSSTAAINDGHRNDMQIFDENCWEIWKIIKRIMDYHTFPASPKVSLGMVDVRDVARAHIRAMECANCNGERILITTTPTVWLSQLTRWLYEEFKDQGFLISRITTPNWLAKLYAKVTCDPHFKAVKYRLGPKLYFDNTKSQQLLQMEYMPIKKSVIDMVYSMLDYGIIVKKKSLEKTKNGDFPSSKMFEEKEPGKPKNWGYTVAIITLMMILNITVIVICRILLDSHDENNNPWLEGRAREYLTLFLGIFSMSFASIVVAVFVAVVQWIANWHHNYFHPSKLLPNAIKITEKIPGSQKRRSM
ncbi:Integrator complex subunit 9-like protein [Dirofilaria immitis]|nr:Integrator complex subunit 9-like protein [Dirofilaria immitis]